MPSLEHRVAHQRDAVMARGPAIRTHAGRAYERLRHPAVLIPAFLGGMLIVRGAPGLRALPRITGPLGRLTRELGKLDALVKLIAALATTLAGPSDAASGGTSGAQSSPRPEDTAHRPPPT